MCCDENKVAIIIYDSNQYDWMWVAVITGKSPQMPIILKGHFHQTAAAECQYQELQYYRSIPCMHQRFVI